MRINGEWSQGALTNGQRSTVLLSADLLSTPLFKNGRFPLNITMQRMTSGEQRYQSLAQ